MTDNENKAYDYRYNVLGSDGLSPSSGTFTIKSPLIGSGGGK